MFIRNAAIFALLLAYVALVAVLSFCRCWSAVVPLLACAGLLESLAHNAIRE